MRFRGLHTSLLMLLSMIGPGQAAAADALAPTRGEWVVRDFRFHTGQVLPELKLAYTTLGNPQGEPVLILHGTAGSADSMLSPGFAGELFGPGQPLDATKHFVILPDSIGTGRSSKPSDGLRTAFPSYNYDDMVDAQYRLLTEHLKVKQFPGSFLIVQSTGGLYDVSRAQREAIRMLESGPAAGVIGTRELCRGMGLTGAIAFDMANQVFGGDFTARLNMNLREDKHWSYGARSGASGAVGQRMWRASAPVQIDKTAESVAEIKREIADFASGKQGATAEEVSGMQKILTLSLPGAYETASSVMGTIGSNVLYSRPDDYVFKRKAEIEAMTPAQVDVAAKALDPNALTWVVVGDLSKTEQVVRALNLGEVTILDADGKPVAKK